MQLCVNQLFFSYISDITIMKDIEYRVNNSTWNAIWKPAVSGTTHKTFYDKIGPYRAITSTTSFCSYWHFFCPLTVSCNEKSSNNSNSSKVRGFTLWPTFSNYTLCSLGMRLWRLLKFLIMSKVVSFMVTFLEGGIVTF